MEPPRFYGWDEGPKSRLLLLRSSFSSALRCRRTLPVPVRVWSRHGDPLRPPQSPSQGLGTGQKQQSGAALLPDPTGKPLLSALMQRFCCHLGDFRWQGKVQRGHAALSHILPPPRKVRALHGKVPALTSESGKVSSRRTGDSSGTGNTDGGSLCSTAGLTLLLGSPCPLPLVALGPLCPVSPEPMAMAQAWGPSRDGSQGPLGGVALNSPLCTPWGPATQMVPCSGMFTMRVAVQVTPSRSLHPWLSPHVHGCPNPCSVPLLFSHPCGCHAKACLHRAPLGCQDDLQGT